jgi:hypothetical protein
MLVMRPESMTQRGLLFTSLQAHEQKGLLIQPIVNENCLD